MGNIFFPIKFSATNPSYLKIDKWWVDIHFRIIKLTSVAPYWYLRKFLFEDRRTNSLLLQKLTKILEIPFEDRRKNSSEVQYELRSSNKAILIVIDIGHADRGSRQGRRCHWSKNRPRTDVLVLGTNPRRGMLGYQRSCPPYDPLFRTTNGGPAQRGGVQTDSQTDRIQTDRHTVRQTQYDES